MNDKNSEKQLQSLVIDDTGYSTLHTKKYEKRKNWSLPNEQEIRTFIPGTVVVLNVKEGSVVKKGDTLMTYEAMKMNNLVKAPHAGKVVNLKVKEGDKLPKNFVMLEIAE